MTLDGEGFIFVHFCLTIKLPNGSLLIASENAEKKKKKKFLQMLPFA